MIKIRPETVWRQGFADVAASAWVTVPVSSYLAMNFTGCTPYTSPSGVEKEMRKAIPLQSLSALCGLILWIVTPFLKS